MNPKPSGSTFTQFAKWTAKQTGRPGAFLFAVGSILLWGVTGPFFHFSDTWQLVINTGTTIITFLMVFLIQHTQNRDTEALQLKLDELIRSIHGARNELLNAEELEEDDLARLQKEFNQLANKARRAELSTSTSSPDATSAAS